MNYFTFLIGVSIVAVLIWLDRKRKKSPEILETLGDHSHAPALRNKTKEPTDDVVAAELDDETHALYQILKSELAQLGTPRLSWRGPQNGWVLGLSEDKGRSGTIILSQCHLIGQLVLTKNQQVGIHTDSRFPTELANDFPVYLGFGRLVRRAHRFNKFPLNSESRARAFVHLMKLADYYYAGEDLYSFASNCNAAFQLRRHPA